MQTYLSDLDYELRKCLNVTVSEQSSKRCLYINNTTVKDSKSFSRGDKVIKTPVEGDASGNGENWRMCGVTYSVCVCVCVRAGR